MAKQKEHAPREKLAGVMRLDRGQGPQLIVTSKRWTDAAEKVFLDALAASCNVRRSAAEAGFSIGAIYRRRRDDPGFADRWQAALDQGYARIEMALVAATGDTLEGFAPDPELPLAPMTVKDAVLVLGLHRATVRGEGRARSWNYRPRTLDELRDSIMTKLGAIERARDAS